MNPRDWVRSRLCTSARSKRFEWNEEESWTLASLTVDDCILNFCLFVARRYSECSKTNVVLIDDLFQYPSFIIVFQLLRLHLN